MEFIYLFIFRSISGLQNGFGYAKKEVHRAITSGAMGLALVITLFFFFRDYEAGVLKALAILAVMGSVLGVIGVEDTFNKNYNLLGKDTHFWEEIATAGITLAFVFLNHNLIPIICSVYPALILHKGFVNKGSNKGFFYAGTDDKSGETYGIPSLGIKIPRMSTMFRLSVAALSVMAMIINLSLKWSLTLTDITTWIGSWL